MDATQRERYAHWAGALALRHDWPVRLAHEVVWWCWYMDHHGHPDWWPPVRGQDGSLVGAGHPRRDPERRA